MPLSEVFSAPANILINQDGGVKNTHAERLLGHLRKGFLGKEEEIYQGDRLIDGWGNNSRDFVFILSEIKDSHTRKKSPFKMIE